MSSLGATANVQGFCPMGCGRTLFLGAGGHVTCAYLPCPRPGAVDEILATRESEHLVTFGPEGFSILHPLKERLDEDLLECALHEYLSSLSGPPFQLGRYRAVKGDQDWLWQEVTS